MKDRVAIAPPLAKCVVALDSLVRCGALAVVFVLIRDLWHEVSQQQPNGDGLASALLTPLVLYVAWSVFMLTMLARGWRDGSLGDAGLLAFVGGLSIVRLTLLRLVADEISYFDSDPWILHEDSLMVLTVASGICAGLAIVAAFQVLILATRQLDGNTHAGEAADDQRTEPGA